MLTRNCAVVQKDNLFTSLPLGNTAGTEIRTRLRLRSTCRGGNNRLDVDKILSYDRGSDLGVPMLGVFLPSPLSCSHQLGSRAHFETCRFCLLTIISRGNITGRCRFVCGAQIMQMARRRRKLGAGSTGVDWHPTRLWHGSTCRTLS
jgi:hypothetical protein